MNSLLPEGSNLLNILSFQCILITALERRHQSTCASRTNRTQQRDCIPAASISNQ